MTVTFLAMPADEQGLLGAGILFTAAGLGLLAWALNRRPRCTARWQRDHIASKEFWTCSLRAEHEGRHLWRKP